MDATRTPTPPPEVPEAEPVDALAMVRRIRDDFAARTAGLPPEELIAAIRRDAAALDAAGGPRRSAA